MCDDAVRLERTALLGYCFMQVAAAGTRAVGQIQGGMKPCSSSPHPSPGPVEFAGGLG